MFKTVLFDLDGTLTDSGEGIINCGKYALKSLGYEVPSDEQMRKMVGPPLHSSFKDFGVKDEDLDEAVRLYRDKYVNKGGKYQNHVYDGIEDMLKSLKSNGISLYVATSKPEQLSKEILAHFNLDKYFIDIAGATLDHTREKKSDVIEYLLKKIENKENVVMVGDTHFDVTGAKALGLSCIGVDWGYGTREELISSGAINVVSSAKELEKFILM